MGSVGSAAIANGAAVERPWPSRPLRVLLLEDTPDDATLVLRALKTGGYDVQHTRAQDAAGMERALHDGAWDVIISDWSMPQFDAPAALALLHRSGLDIPFIITSGTITEESAVEALRAGASDFLLKHQLSRLVPAVERELREHAQREARRKAEDEVRASEARYRELFEGSPLPMWVYDAQTLAFVGVNEAAVRHYGYSREEFLRLTVLDIRLDDEPGTFPGASRHRKKDGSTILVEITAHNLSATGGRLRMAIANDVTERVRAQEALSKTEEQLRHAQKMEAVGRLAGGVAHDFNNVLSVILSYAEMTLADLKDGDPMRADISEICAAGRRAADITKQLLLFSRQDVAHPRLLDFTQVISGMEKMLRRLLGADVELSLLLSPSGTVRADAGHLEQVVMNLAINARDAMPDGGRLTIATESVELDEEYAREQHGVAPGRYTLLSVTDTGVGMDRETQARVFEPFFTTKEKGKGTGLGLSIVFGIVQQAGGAIHIYSEVGKGTTFRIYLPSIASAETAPSVPPPSTEKARGDETVLLVEDDPQLRAVVCGCLQRLGYRVIAASNGGEALLLCEQHEGAIDLILTDIVLPHMSGRQFVERIAPLRPDARVLFMSGYAADAVRQHGVLDSTAEFLQKPITPQSLGRKVREILDGRRRPVHGTGGVV